MADQDIPFGAGGGGGGGHEITLYTRELSGVLESEN